MVLTGYGINCDRETQFAFNQAGAIAERVHVNELIGGRVKLSDYQILALPGGFSYGDDLGAGVALANRMRTRLGYDVKRFIDNAKLVIGICNGFQVMANFGLLPALNGGPDSQNVVLTHNDRPRYLDRWVDLQFLGNTPWLKGMQRASFPIAHGEGKFYANPATLRSVRENLRIAARYIDGNICHDRGYEPNPNGSLDSIAGITDPSGRVLGMMPHPERAIHFTQLPNWTLLKEKLKRAGEDIPEEGPGMKLFRNGVNYFE